MLLHHVKIAMRNLLKNKLFSFINIAGMAVSLASCFLIALFVWDELQYDRQLPHADRLYRIYNIVTAGEGVKSYLPIVPYPFASYMQKDFPEIEGTLRLMDTYEQQLIEVGNAKILESGGVYAEPSVFDMLGIRIVSGNALEALIKPNTIALSSALAKKYFGDKSPLGESIKVSGEVYEVTAAYTDPSKHFHLKINYLLSFASTGWATRFESNWQRQQIFTYLKLKPGADANALERKFKPFVEKYAYPQLLSSGISYVPYL